MRAYGALPEYGEGHHELPKGSKLSNIRLGFQQLAGTTIPAHVCIIKEASS
jgi:hypothetical protein